MHDRKIWEFILRHLNHGDPVMLLCVLESRGSSPGRKGFRMAVAEKEMFGYIGGGIMEHKFVEMAKQKLAEETNESILKQQFHTKTARNQSGMICSGEQTVLLYRPLKSDITEITSIINCLSENRNALIRITPQRIQFEDQIPAFDFNFYMNAEDDWLFEEKIGYKNTLHIIGGGHCSYALSRIMSSLDFYLHLYEDRKELNTFNENNFVHRKIVVDSYNLLPSHIRADNSAYAVIMTFGYRTDDIAFRSIYNLPFKYLGVLGSKTKLDQLYKEWEADGISSEKLKSIHAPVGLQIKSQTPDEIAVSIAAEIIKIKNADLS